MDLKPGVLQHRPEGELVVDEDALEFLEDCEHREKQLIRRIDWRLLPIIGALYAISLIDRTNVRPSLLSKYESRKQSSHNSLDIERPYSRLGQRVETVY